MKRGLLGLLVTLLVLVLIGVVATSFFFGTLLKRGIESTGSKLTQVEVQLSGAHLAVFSGSGELKGLVVGNPPGFKTPSAIKAGAIAVNVAPMSIVSSKVLVRSIRVEGPEVTFEAGLQGNNLSTLLANVRAAGGSSSSSPGSAPAGSSRKLEVDDLLVTGGKINVNVNVVGNQSASVALPDIHLSGLGQGPDGITAAELSEKLLNALVESATKAAASGVGSLGAQVLGTGGSVSTGAVQQLEKAGKSIGNLFKPK